MQCKCYQILLGRTYEWSLWRGAHFIEVVFKTGSTVIDSLLMQFFYIQNRKMYSTKKILYQLLRSFFTLLGIASPRKTFFISLQSTKNLKKLNQP